MKRGFQRVKVDGHFYEIDDVPELEKNRTHDIDVVVDRVVLQKRGDNRLADSLETALKLADGLARVEFAGDAPKGLENGIIFSERFACPVSGFTIDAIEPRLFSFNNPRGACAQCGGLGVKSFVDPNRVIGHAKRSLREGAIAPWSQRSSPYYLQTLDSLARHYKFSCDTPWQDLPAKIQKMLLTGSGEQTIAFRYKSDGRSYEVRRPFEGIIPNLERRYKETESEWMREEIARYHSVRHCDACDGYRLGTKALAVKVGGLHIGELTAMSIEKSYTWFASVTESFTSQHAEIAKRILKEIRDRLHFLISVGLGYLTLSRNAGTLSGGESQRIRLASQIGSGLTGVLYVLDEPSIGLHQRDNARLLDMLARLRDLGNTVIVVEHDEDAILTADYVVDIGPGAGLHGGEIVAQGSSADIMRTQKSLTGQYLKGTKAIAIPAKRRPCRGPFLSVKGATGNNLKNISASIPLQSFTCVTGVSGSGKSSLVIETLYKALARQLSSARDLPAPFQAVENMQLLDKVVDIDQSPIGRTPRSNPATYTGSFTPIREWYTALPEARARGYTAGRFSFNVKGGRCETCQGDGVIKIEMHFLPDVFVMCEACQGKRYNRETLEILFRGQSIADVLGMTVDTACDFFKAVPSIRDKMAMLKKVGLGYIKVGQQATTLSGGEAQRVKLAKELSRRSTGKTLYILDEPTTGLHFHDIAKLLEVLHALVDKGNTVVVIEHNLEVIKTADWIVDMGPEGGDAGGYVVARGTPEAIALVKKSYTGQYLQRTLAKTKAKPTPTATAKPTPKPKPKVTPKPKLKATAKARAKPKPKVTPKATAKPKPKVTAKARAKPKPTATVKPKPLSNAP